MTLVKANLLLPIEYDPELTSPEDIAQCLDGILHNALSTEGILDECENPVVGEFWAQDPEPPDELEEAYPAPK
jgi:hypothetical protein